MRFFFFFFPSCSLVDIANILCDLKSPLPRDKEANTAEKINVQYRELQLYINNLPSFNPNESKIADKFRRLCPPVSSYKLLRKDEAAKPRQLSRGGKMMKEHKAALELIQKRLLRAAEQILILLIEKSIDIDDARADLKATIKSYEEVLVSECCVLYSN